jgi:TusA-related sulfurtransferase
MQPIIVERDEQPYATVTRGARLEVLMTDPAEQPDMRQWRTDLYFRLAD